ncbi:MAG: Gluconolactonase, partial [uncultured Thermomicrobiales bacterium]
GVDLRAGGGTVLVHRGAGVGWHRPPLHRHPEQPDHALRPRDRRLRRMARRDERRERPAPGGGRALRLRGRRAAGRALRGRWRRDGPGRAVRGAAAEQPQRPDDRRAGPRLVHRPALRRESRGHGTRPRVGLPPRPVRGRLVGDHARDVRHDPAQRPRLLPRRWHPLPRGIPPGPRGRAPVARLPAQWRRHTRRGARPARLRRTSRDRWDARRRRRHDRGELRLGAGRAGSADRRLRARWDRAGRAPDADEPDQLRLRRRRPAWPLRHWLRRLPLPRAGRSPGV